LGVARIVPVITKLADVRLRDEGDAVKRTARWQRIALEAAKQSGRARVPEINQPLLFNKLISDAPVNVETVRLLFSEREGASLSETIKGWSNIPQEATALVGSEGGWTDEELTSAHDAGWTIITLGGRIMRAETAAIIITALLQHILGDLK
jgi:16S rRNA (uracil1498-N3)-methyltransferase